MTRKFFIKLTNAKFHTDSRWDSRPFSTWAKVRTGSDSDDPQRRVLTTQRREHFLKLCLNLWRFPGMLRITALHSVHDMTLRTNGVNVELV
jgi:hypothetical protein